MEEKKREDYWYEYTKESYIKYCKGRIEPYSVIEAIKEHDRRGYKDNEGWFFFLYYDIRPHFLSEEDFDEYYEQYDEENKEYFEQLKKYGYFDD